jgi:Glycine zipper 2TM domain
MQTKLSRAVAKTLAVTLVAGLTLEAAAASAQPPPPGYGPPPSYGPPPGAPPAYGPPGYAPSGGPQVAPPPGQYAPPPPGYEGQGAVYDDRAQAADRDYADRYSRWAQQYCMDRRNNHTAAGAIIGGILGAVVGSNVSGRGSRTGGSIIGGALGATAGAAIGSSSAESADCPPGYYIRAGAPRFAYGPPPPYGPAWYNPWFFEGGVWLYRPYRYWYWTHDAYWAPGYRPGRWEYRYRRW